MTVPRRSRSNGRKPPTAAVRAKPNRRFPAEVLTDEEVRALIGACPSTSATGLRNRALLAILYRTGLRIAEALDLYPRTLISHVARSASCTARATRPASSASIEVLWPSSNAGSTFAPVAATVRHGRSSALPRENG